MLFFVAVSPTSSDKVKGSSSSFSPNSSQGTGAITNYSQSSPQQQLNNSSSLASQTLSDLKKQRSMSRAVHQQHNNSQQPEEGEAPSGKKRSPDKQQQQQRSNNNKRETGSGNRRGPRDEHVSGQDSGPASIDVLKFSAGTSEVVGPPKKTSCCKIL